MNASNTQFERELVIAYDRKDVDSTTAMQKVVQTLVNAEADNLRPVLQTVIEFQLNFSKGRSEFMWVMKKIEEELEACVFFKIYPFDESYGKEKRYNPNLNESNGIIGKSFNDCFLKAQAAKKSFRSEYRGDIK